VRRERSASGPLLVYDELPAGAAAVRVRGGYLVSDRFMAVNPRTPPASLNRRALDDLPGEDSRPPGKLRWRRCGAILSVR
jgi:hypothetical protein